MPRGPRLDSPGTLHHVMARGIDKLKIFRAKKDYEDFLDRLESVVEDDELRVYAWALIPSHFHILVRSGPNPLSSAMRKVMTGYAVSYNMRRKRHGHVFRNRYRSIVCEDEPYLLELVRYIHLNPLRAGLVKDLDELARYRWVGHGALMGNVKREWQDTAEVLARFSGEESEARKRYTAFVADGVEEGERPDLTGGGLIRSAGGWSEVLGLRRRKERMASDCRILGSGEFVEQMLRDVEERQADTLRLRRVGISLNEIVEDVARHRGLEAEEVISGGRRRVITEARNDISQLAVRRLGYSGAEVARHLGVTTSCVNRHVATGEMSDVAQSVADSWSP
jgi:putative transposase